MEIEMSVIKKSAYARSIERECEITELKNKLREKNEKEERDGVKCMIYKFLMAFFFIFALGGMYQMELKQAHKRETTLALREAESLRRELKEAKALIKISRINARARGYAF